MATWAALTEVLPKAKKLASEFGYEAVWVAADSELQSATEAVQALGVSTDASAPQLREEEWAKL